MRLTGFSLFLSYILYSYVFLMLENKENKGIEEEDRKKDMERCVTFFSLKESQRVDDYVADDDDDSFCRGGGEQRTRWDHF